MSSGDTELVWGSGRTLEELLRPDFKITLATDVADFLLVSGLDYWDNQAYGQASRELQAQAQWRYLRRRADDKTGRGVRLRGELVEAYRRREIRTLKDVKRHLIVDRGWRKVGDKSLEYLGGLLFEKYGIEPFRLPFTPSYLREKRKYGDSKYVSSG